jgi:hypothetical protein
MINGKKLVEGWIRILEGYEPSKIVKMYSDNGILLGTLAPKPLIGREEIKTYFNDFVKLHPIGVVTWYYTQRLGFSKLVVDGNYTFEIDHKKARKEVDARFTFIFKRNWLRFGKWEIMTHHSSERPIKTKVI